MFVSTVNTPYIIKLCPGIRGKSGLEYIMMSKEYHNFNDFLFTVDVDSKVCEGGSPSSFLLRGLKALLGSTLGVNNFTGSK